MVTGDYGGHLLRRRRRPRGTPASVAAPALESLSSPLALLRKLGITALHIKLRATGANKTKSPSPGAQSGPVVETLAYDLLMKAATSALQFHSCNFRIYGTWKWLLTPETIMEFPIRIQSGGWTMLEASLIAPEAINATASGSKSHS